MQRKLDSLKKVHEDFKEGRSDEDFIIERSDSLNYDDYLIKIRSKDNGLIAIFRVGFSKFVYSISKDYPDLEVLCEGLKEGDSNE